MTSPLDRAAIFDALGDPVRRSLFRLATRRALSRDDAAEALGIPRSTAASHLERMTAAGLLTAHFERLSGRSGPGAGRPAKLYRAVAAELVGSVPERHYDFAADLLASAIERAERESVPVREALAGDAFAAGVAIGAAGDDLEQALTRCGYEPRTDSTGDVVLDNCPFHELADRHTPLVCGANLELVKGAAAATGDERAAVLTPRAGHCCVRVTGAPAISRGNLSPPG